MKNLIAILFFVLPFVGWGQEYILEYPVSESDTDSCVMPEYVGIIDTPPFPGGYDSLRKFIKTNLKYPEQDKKDSIVGKVIVGFIIEPNGSISDVKIIKGVHPLLDNEALRVVNLLPNFTPGYQNGKAVNVPYYIPINFKLK